MSEQKGSLFRLQRFSVHDGPGIRTTVFLKGCPLRCLWCHNPESQSPGFELFLNREKCTGCGACRTFCPRVFSPDCRRCGACAAVCPSGARERCGEEKTVGEVMEELLRDLPYYRASSGGVTVSGGEPLLQPEFTHLLLTECRRAGIHTALETAGFAEPSVLPEMIPATDLFLYDLKAWDAALHRRLTGVGNARILKNAELLKGAGANIRFRMPYVPGYNDGELRSLAEFAAPFPLEIMPYHNLCAGKYRALDRTFPTSDAPVPSADRLRQAAENLVNVIVPD